ncbi:hypothetical protein ACU8KH_00555 [Lachancea thermotolerans]
MTGLGCLLTIALELSDSNLGLLFVAWKKKIVINTRALSEISKAELNVEGYCIKD